MSYKIILEKRARKFIEKQPINQQKRILKAVMCLPDNGDIKQLKGDTGYYRLRVGDYRIIYKVEHNILTVIVTDAGNRGQIYK
ncbi:MAG: type II toxin-antitoxin system RelE/ParE family toxin [Ruminococcus sp.]|nr:type II toxin-antitoxin system RelE/ParE family toxin [Ruminococcus sp.]